MKSRSSRSSASRSELPDLSPSEATRRAIQAVRNELGTDFAFNLTPPFPVVWPPARDTTVVYFAYGRDPLPTSTVRYRVYSPSARVDVDIADVSGSSTRVRRLRDRPLKGSEAKAIREGAPGQMAAAEQALFEALASLEQPSPAAGAAGLIRTAYEDWIAQHPSLAGEVRKELPQFFVWLETAGNKPGAHRRGAD